MSLNFKKAGGFSVAIVWIVTVVIAFYVGMMYQWASSTEIKTDKEYSQITVEENDIADYRVFIEIPDKYSALEQIDGSARQMISLYMQANNLKLSEGTHRFTRSDGSLDEYISSEFRFEEIE